MEMAESIEARLVRMETKVDVLLEYHRIETGKFEKMETRIAGLEKFEAKLLGGAALISVCIAIAFKVL